MTQLIKTHFTAIQCLGADAESFLDGQLTAALKPLANNEWTWAAHCDAKGRMHSLLIVIKLSSSEFLMLATDDNAEHAKSALAKFAVFSKVELSLTDLDIVADTHSPSKVSKQVRDDNQRMMLSFTDGIELQIGQSIDASDGNFKDLFVQSGMPWFDAELTSTIIPQYIDLDLNGGVAFNKGCYQGQEVVARLHFKGSVKKARALANCDDEKLFDADGRKRAALLTSARPQSLYLLDKRCDALYDHNKNRVELTVLSPERD